MKKFNQLMGAVFILTGSLCHAPQAAASLLEAFMVASGDGNAKPAQIYRIPAVTTMPDGTLVALFDDRGSSYDDLPTSAGGSNSAIRVKAAISRNQGHEWMESVDVAPSLKAPFGDAAICYDRERNRLLAVLNAERSFNASSGSKVYYVTSTDGISWTDPAEITSQFSNAISDYRLGFVTSGNMLQTSSGDIYCAFLCKRRKNFLSTAKYLEIFKTSDGGATWSLVNGSHLFENNCDESHLAELPDGRLLLSVRNAGHRLFSYSGDGGATWSAPSDHSGAMLDCGVNSDILAFSDGGTDYLLQVIATEDSNGRQKLFAYWSTDDGLTWQSRRLYHGYAGYASLTRLKDGTFGCLAEVGGFPQSPNKGGMSMVFFRFDLDWLLNDEHDTFNGTLATLGTGYMRIPADDAFSIPAGGGMTVSARVWFPIWGEPGGIVANRYCPSDNEYSDAAGFAFIAGWESSRCLSSNVTVDGSHGPWSPGVLNHSFDNTAGSINPGEWHHVAWSFDSPSGASTLYIDGEMVERVTSAKIGTEPQNMPISCLHDMLVGARHKDASNPIDVWTGEIDDVRFYKGVLSEEELRRDAVEGFPVRDKDNGLIAAYDFENIVFAGEGDDLVRTVTDISGNGHDGELRGAWPEAPKTHTTRVIPTDYGTLTVDYFVDGVRHTLNEGEAITRSVNADYYVSFTPEEGLTEDGFEFVGIFADGRLIDNNSFFKTYSNGEVYVLYNVEPLRFELVNDGYNYYRAPFVYDTDADVYRLEWPHDGGLFHGDYHVEEVAEPALLSARDIPARSPLTLYSAERNDFSIDEPIFRSVRDENHVVVNRTVDSRRISFRAPTDEQHNALLNTRFTLRYTPQEHTLAIHYDDVVTGVESVGTDIDGAPAADAPVRWFNLQGVEVTSRAGSLAPGVYVRVQGGSSSKVLVR